MSRRITRRQALAASAATLGYLHLAPAVSAKRVFRANEKLRVAGIGVGGKGSSDIDQAGNLMTVVALCDIDDGKLGAKAKKWPEAKTFVDFRKLFDDSALLKNIDAVTVSTPDHTHALASILAMRAGKHVYCQKPLTHDVYEARLMRAEAKKNKVCTQMGNQGTAANGLRRAVELLQRRHARRRGRSPRVDEPADLAAGARRSPRRSRRRPAPCRRASTGTSSSASRRSGRT